VLLEILPCELVKMVAEAGKLGVLNFSAVGITEKADCSPIKLGSNRTAVEVAASHGREPALSEVEGALAPPNKMTEAAKNLLGRWHGAHPAHF
jgi:pyridoxal biosynthesis lyase PdxS